MKRREFITLLGGVVAWPIAARAQPPEKVPTIGFLGSLSQSAQSTWTAAFVQRMREYGWIEDRTVVIEYRWAEGRAGNVHRSRHALNADTIREMHAAFRRGGRKAIEKVMRNQPAVFLKLLVLLVP